MVKVKGQISEIAVCLVDAGDSTKEMAAQFFAELATKGNALYNVILDIASRLSDPEVGVNEEKFQVVCCELFRHIAADKQCESLMERFLLRFRATTDERHWRDISFCLSRLSYTEKSLKKMLDRFSCFADKLADDAIYTNFMTIIEKSTQRLKLKPGAKEEIITELTAKIDVAHNRGVEDAEAMETATENLLKKPSTKGQSRKKRRTRRGNASSDEDDYASDTSTCSRISTTSSVSVTQRTGARRSTRKVAPMNPLENLLHQLEEESDEDQENLTPAPKTKVGKKLALSSSDEEISAEAVLTPAAFRGRSTRSRRK
ncbi:condensin complex subunit 1-like [Watersipora subatra]|uniref:condensin complex subunit 1-like n=1 Tax=Watersipora subatra TaxID=2589382 RepID=UPI00355B74CB